MTKQAPQDPERDPENGGSWDETLPDQGQDGTLYQPGEEELQELPGEATLVPEPALSSAPGDPPARPRPVSGKALVFADRFEVVRELGAGGMGRVYLVRDRQIEGRQVALKVLHPKLSRNKRFRELFFQEIHAAQGFVSENVVQVRDTGQMKDGTLFLTMDMVEGESLDRMLSRESSLSARHALEITRQILTALASGHEQGFVHRDVKPSNVMLAARVPKSDDNPFGVGVRLLDFGIAGLVAEVGEGQVVGTPRYMSPEQVQGQRLDARSDLFAVGIILYEMLSGSRPFDGKTPQEIQTAVLETKISPLITRLERVPEATRKIVAKALQKDRAKRFQSAAEFIKAIEKSEAFKEPKGVPAWVAGLLLLTTGAAAAEGYLLVEKEKSLEAKQSEINSILENKTSDVQAASQLSEKARLEYEGRLAEKDNEIARLGRELTNTSDALIRQQGSLDLCESDKIEATTKYQDEKKLREKLEGRIALLEADNEKIKEEQARLRQNQDPGFLASNFYDVLIRKALGTPREALQAIENARAVGDEPIPFDQGRGHVDSVVEAAAAVEVAEGHLLPFADDPGAPALAVQDKQAAFEALVLARQKLTDAERTAQDFAQDALPWLDFALDSDGPAAGPNEGVTGQPVEASVTESGVDAADLRLEAIASLRASLATRIDRLEGIRATLDEREQGEIEATRQRLLSLDPDADPTEALAYLRAMGPESLEALVDRVGATYLSRVERDGDLDLGRLARDVPHLREWAGYALDGGASLRGDGAGALRWLWAARQWYGGSALGPELQAVVSQPAIRPASDEPHHEWRAELQLQFALLKGRSETFALPEGTLVFRNTWARDGKVTWLLDRVTGGDGRWTLSRQLYDLSGRSSGGQSQELAISYEDGALYVANDKVLDLYAQGEHVLVGVWRPKLDPRLPDAAWTNGMDGDRFDAALADGIPVLIYRQGDAEYWHAPGLGVVKHVLNERFEREIRYSTLVR